MKRLLLIIFYCMAIITNISLHAKQQKIQPIDMGASKEWRNISPDKANPKLIGGYAANKYLYIQQDGKTLPASAPWKDKNMIFVINETDNDYNFRVEVKSGGSDNDFDSCVAKRKIVAVYASHLYADNEKYFRFSIYKPGKDCTDIVSDNKIGTVEFKAWDRESEVFNIELDSDGNPTLRIWAANSVDTIQNTIKFK